MNRLKKEYLKTMAWLDSLNQNKIFPGLDRIKDLMFILGNPQNLMKTIVIGGTNAKGSTCFNLSHNMTMSGLKIGCFTSPHLHSVRERIQIGKDMINIEDFTKLLLKLKNIIEKEKMKITYFEVLTAAAYYHFYKKHVDYAVMEIGLGGEWDAVNISEPKIAILTTLGIDHKEYLGKKLEDIAKTKAKIVKENSHTITGWPKEYHKYIPNCKSINFGKDIREWLTIAVEKLGIDIDIELKNIPGRMEVFKNWTLDTGHNPQAIEFLINEKCDYDCIIIGILKDKEAEEIINKLPSEADILVCNLNTQRALSNKELKNICKKKGLHCQSFDTVKDAIIYSENKNTLILGSFYTVAEAREHLKLKGHREL